MLIEGMTKQEKIFFNRFAQIANNKKNKHYLTLFKLIEKQLKKNKAIDEEQLKKKFPYLSVEKRYLMNILIKSLTAFHENDEGFYAVKTLIKQIYILVDKGIYLEAQKLHAKAVKIAERYNLFEDLMSLNNIRVALRGHRDILSDLNIMKAIIDDQNKKIGQLLNYDQYRLYMYQLQDWIRTNGYIDTPQKEAEFNQLIASPLIDNISEAKSDRAIELFYNARIYIWGLQYNFRKKYEEFQQRIAFMKEHPHLYSPYNKIIFTNNYLMCCIRVGAIEECEEQLLVLEEYIQQYPLSLERVMVCLYTRKLEFYSHIGAFEKNRAWLLEVEKGLYLCQNLTPLQSEYLYLYLGRAYMELGDYEKALEHLYKVGAFKIFDKTSVTYSAAKLLVLICYYELGWYSNLESALISFYRQIRKAKVQYKLYESLLKYLKLGIANRDLTNKNTLYFFSSEWENISPDSRESIPFQFFHYKKWLRSKIENKPLDTYF